MKLLTLPIIHLCSRKWCRSWTPILALYYFMATKYHTDCAWRLTHLQPLVHRESYQGCTTISRQRGTNLKYQFSTETTLSNLYQVAFKH